MLSLDFADTAIIEIIATARIIAAIVPNSGITKVPITVKRASSANDVRLFILLRFASVSIYVYLKIEKSCELSILE